MPDFRLPAFELIYVIVNQGMGSRVLKKAKEICIAGDTVFLGRGIVDNSLLNFLSLYEERKEIVLLGVDTRRAGDALTKLEKEFQFEKPHRGLAFAVTACGVIGATCYELEKNEESRGVDKPMYHLITTIVNRGEAEDVIEAASSAGSKGGTIINARGSGASKLFHMDIEPEKEMVMIIVQMDITQAVVDSIREHLEIDKPGHGVIFVQGINAVYGLHE